VIAGGGLGGLAAALFLRRAGVADVTVIEQNTGPSEIGAGIQVAPNAMRLLYRLGLRQALDAVAVPFEVAWEIRRWEDGRILFEQRFGAEGEALFGAPYMTFHRGDLIGILAAAVPEGVVEYGRAVVSVADGKVVLADGSTRDFDVLVGADGIHSIVREAVVGPDQPEFTGLAAFRALVPADEAPAFARRPVCSIWLGPGRHFVHYPVSGGRQINLVTAHPAGDWRTESWTAPGEVSDFLAAFAGWAPDVLQLIGAARETKLYAFYSRPPIDRWVTDRVALLGDAAHPMLPFFAQGAAMGFEDAAVLAKCLAGVEEPGVAAALQRYAAVRRERATRVQTMSGARREENHLPDGTEQEARDAAFAAEDPLGHNAWLYAHDVEAGL